MFEVPTYGSNTGVPLVKQSYLKAVMFVGLHAVLPDMAFVILEYRYESIQPWISHASFRYVTTSVIVCCGLKYLL